MLVHCLVIIKADLISIFLSKASLSNIIHTSEHAASSKRLPILIKTLLISPVALPKLL
jgi:hypothetical protein